MNKYIASILGASTFIGFFLSLAIIGVKDIGTVYPSHVYEVENSFYSVFLNVSIFLLGVAAVFDFRRDDLRFNRLSASLSYGFVFYVIFIFGITLSGAGKVLETYTIDGEFVIRVLLYTLLPFAWGGIVSYCAGKDLQ